MLLGNLSVAPRGARWFARHGNQLILQLCLQCPCRLRTAPRFPREDLRPIALPLYLAISPPDARPSNHLIDQHHFQPCLKPCHLYRNRPPTQPHCLRKTRPCRLYWRPLNHQPILSSCARPHFRRHLGLLLLNRCPLAGLQNTLQQH